MFPQKPEQNPGCYAATVFVVKSGPFQTYLDDNCSPIPEGASQTHGGASLPPARGGSRGGAIGVIATLKPKKVTLFTMSFYNSENDLTRPLDSSQNQTAIAVSVGGRFNTWQNNFGGAGPWNKCRHFNLDGSAKARKGTSL